MAGAQKVLVRLLAKQGKTQTLSFLTISQNSLRNVEYVVESSVTRVSNSIKRSGLTKVQIHVEGGTDEALLAGAEGEEEPIDWEALSLQTELCYLSNSGTYDYVKFLGQVWFADPNFPSSGQYIFLSS
jgi:hypothetical protein